METAKGFAAFLQRNVTPGEPGNDRAARERKLTFPEGLDRCVVAQNGAQIVEVAFFVGHGDQAPVAVSGGDFDSEDRGGLSIGLSRCGGRRRPRPLADVWNIELDDALVKDVMVGVGELDQHPGREAGSG